MNARPLPRIISSKELEKSRKTWATVAKNYNWFQTPFYIQVWVNTKGVIIDSVSFRGLKKDLIVDNAKEVILKSNQYKIV